jgi:hypothetical protein
LNKKTYYVVVNFCHFNKKSIQFHISSPDGVDWTVPKIRGNGLWYNYGCWTLFRLLWVCLMSLKCSTARFIFKAITGRCCVSNQKQCCKADTSPVRDTLYYNCKSHELFELRVMYLVYCFSCLVGA